MLKLMSVKIFAILRSKILLSKPILPPVTVHDIFVLIAYGSSTGLDEPEPPFILARAFTACTHKVTMQV